MNPLIISDKWEQVTHCCQFVGKDQAGQSLLRLPTVDSGMFKGATFFKCQGDMVTAVHPTEAQVRDVFLPLMHKPECVIVSYDTLRAYHDEDLGGDVLLALGHDKRPPTMTFLALNGVTSFS